MSRIRKMFTDALKRSFFRLLLAWAPVNKEPLTLFSQVLDTSLHQSFSIYQILRIRKCLQMCWKEAFSGFCPVCIYMQISGKRGHGNFSISWESGDWSREATPWDSSMSHGSREATPWDFGMFYRSREATPWEL